jgi:hypothetical protein
MEEYHQQFEALSYRITIQNPHYAEQFFVSQFIKGLKTKISGMVEAQVPETVERAILLALVQQEVLADAKPWHSKHGLQARPEAPGLKPEAPKQHLKIGNEEL